MVIRERKGSSEVKWEGHITLKAYLSQLKLTPTQSYPLPKQCQQLRPEVQTPEPCRGHFPSKLKELVYFHSLLPTTSLLPVSINSVYGHDQNILDLGVSWEGV